MHPLLAKRLLAAAVGCCSCSCFRCAAPCLPVCPLAGWLTIKCWFEVRGPRPSLILRPHRSASSWIAAHFEYASRC